MKVVFAHAGAGNLEVVSHDTTMIRCVEAGLNALGNKIEEAVIAAVEVLQDAPETNAGLGSSLNLRGEVEMDAALMIPGDFGAVASVRNVRSAIRLAWHVLHDSGHKLLVGGGAEEFARVMNLPKREGGEVREESYATWSKAVKSLRDGQKLDWEHSLGVRQELLDKYGIQSDTVGALALDDHGNLAVGSSTGGLFMKLPGRAGDTPLPGAGLWCTKEIAVACTGYGEAFIRSLTARRVEELFRTGSLPVEAVETALDELWGLTKGRGGIIALTREGEIASTYNSDTLPVGLVQDGCVVSDYLPKKLSH